MDIKSLVDKLDISAVKIFFLRIFDKEALYEYILDKANSGVNLLLVAYSVEIADIRSALKKVNGYLVRYMNYLPESWMSYATVCNDCLITVYKATEDGKIVSEEAKEMIRKFQIAYSAYKAD